MSEEEKRVQEGGALDAPGPCGRVPAGRGETFNRAVVFSGGAIVQGDKGV